LAKRKELSQGHIIDEIRKVREALWTEYKGDMRKMAASGRKIAEKYGMKILESPSLSRRKVHAQKSRKKQAA
jgi:hypothetical protein